MPNFNGFEFYTINDALYKKVYFLFLQIMNYQFLIATDRDRTVY